MSYTPEQWATIQRNAHAALQADPTNERARAALKASIPHLEQANAALGQQEMQEAQDPGALASFGLGASQGATFGFGDEAAALLAAAGAIIPGGRSPGDAGRAQLEETRSATAAGRAEHPIPYWTGEIGGGLATILPGAGAAGVAGRGVAQGVARVGLPRVGRVVGRITQGGLTGAAAAGLESAGRSEGDVGDRLGAAADALPAGAIIGGALGLAGPFAAEFLKSGGRKAMSMTGLGPQGWVRRGARRLVGEAEAKAPKAAAQSVPAPKVKTRKRPPITAIEGTEGRGFEVQGTRATPPVPTTPTLAEMQHGMTPRNMAPDDIMRAMASPNGSRFVKPGPHQKAGPPVRSQSPKAPSGILAGQEEVITKFLQGASPEEIPARLEQMRAVGIRVPAEVEAELIAAAEVGGSAR